MPRSPSKQRDVQRSQVWEKSWLSKWLEEIMAFIIIVLTLFWCLLSPDSGLVPYMPSNPQSNTICWVSLPPLYIWINRGLAKALQLVQCHTARKCWCKTFTQVTWLQSPLLSHCLIFLELGRGLQPSPAALLCGWAHLASYLSLLVSSFPLLFHSSEAQWERSPRAAIFLGLASSQP